MPTRKFITAVADLFRHPLRHWKCNVIVAVALTAVIAGVWAGWECVLKDRLVPKRWGVVVPGEVYRSGMLHPDLWQPTLEQYDIRIIVSLLGEEVGRPDQDAERRVAEALGIERIVLPMRGNGRGDVQRYADAIETIVQARRRQQPTLVHCAAGTNRTGAVVALYRVLIQRQSPGEAAAEMMKYRYNLQRNRQLLEYLNVSMDAVARELVQRGVLQRVPEPLPQFPMETP